VLQLNQGESDAIATFNNHTDSVYCVDWMETPDGTVFVSGDLKDKAFVWKIEAKNEADIEAEESKTDAPIQKFKSSQTAELPGHTETVEFCKFDSSKKWLVTGGMNNVLRVWDVANGFSLKRTLDQIPQEDLNFVEWH
jgi:WD40 repeat protein